MATVIEPRQYQTEAVASVRNAIREVKSCLLVLPTGSGKTVVAGMIASGAASKGTRTMFLVHRRELVVQAYQTLAKHLPKDFEIGIEAAGFPRTPWAKMQIGMVQSLKSRLDTIEPPRLIFIDEAHHARAETWNVLLERWKEAYRIGLTATPERLDGKGLGMHFERMIEGPSIAELVEDGYLSPQRVLRPPVDLLSGALRVGRSGDYMKTDVENQWKENRDRLAVNAVTSCLRYCEGKRTIFFGRTVGHSQDVASRLRGYGVAAEHVDGTTRSAHRDRVMEAFRSGEVQVICNVRLIDEGFDVPDCEAVIVGFPTKSVTRWLQCAGRGMRPQDGKVMTLVDLEGASRHLGLPSDPRIWSLADGQEKKTTQSRDLQECVECHTMHYSVLCPVCNGPQPDDKVEVDVELEEVEPQPPLRKRTRRELNRELYLARQSDDPVAALNQIAIESGYKSGWVWRMRKLWEI